MFGWYPVVHKSLWGDVFLRFIYGKPEISWKYVDSNELKVSWFQWKSFLINRFLWGWKGKSIESRLISIETLTWVDHPEFPRPVPQENAELLSRLKLFGGATLISIQHYPPIPFSPVAPPWKWAPYAMNNHLSSFDSHCRPTAPQPFSASSRIFAANLAHPAMTGLRILLFGRSKLPAMFWFSPPNAPSLAELKHCRAAGQCAHLQNPLGKQQITCNKHHLAAKLKSLIFQQSIRALLSRFRTCCLST